MDNNKDEKVLWYDDPNFITNLIILLIGIIVILSQSFAVNSDLSVISTFSNIVNHNILYLLVCIYFVALKTRTGKKYFDFLNIFLIVLYGINAVTSLLTIFQSFSLGTVLDLSIDLLLIIYLFHTLLRSSRVWKSMNLSKSPFNEITNDGYFSTIFIIAIILLAVNLISTTSLNGTILALLDTTYTILFTRYIFLYGRFLDSKKISVNNEGNFDNYREKINDGVNNFVSEHGLEDEYESVVEITESVKNKINEIKDDVTEEIEKIVDKDNNKQDEVFSKENNAVTSLEKDTITKEKSAGKPKSEITSRKKKSSKKTGSKRVEK